MDSSLPTPDPERVARGKLPYNRPVGRPPTHGARQLVRVLKNVPLRAVDGRTAVGAALRRAHRDLLAHLGDDATVPELVLAEEAAKAEVICAALGSWILQQRSLVRPNGEVLAAVETHSRLVGSLVRLLAAIGMKRKAREVSVADLAQQLHAERANGATKHERARERADVNAMPSTPHAGGREMRPPLRRPSWRLRLHNSDLSAGNLISRA